jgi:hypothetical protein
MLGNVILSFSLAVKHNLAGDVTICGVYELPQPINFMTTCCSLNDGQQSCAVFFCAAWQSVYVRVRCPFNEV